MMLNQLIESMSLSYKHELLLRETLIPAHYLMIASKKAKTAEVRHQIRQQAEQLFSKKPRDIPIANKSLFVMVEAAFTSIATISSRLFSIRISTSTCSLSR